MENLPFCSVISDNVQLMRLDDESYDNNE